jgi:hypothetical protein
MRSRRAWRTALLAVVAAAAATAVPLAASAVRGPAVRPMAQTGQTLTGASVGLPYDAPTTTRGRTDGGDTWYNTWAANGDIYATSDDSHGYTGTCQNGANLAVNELTGGDPSELASPYTNCMTSYGLSGNEEHCAAGSKTCYHDGRTWKSEGIIAVGGTLYLAVARQVDGQGGYPNGYQPSDDASLVKSANNGRTWSNGFGTRDSPAGAAPPALSAHGSRPGARSMFPAAFTTPQFISYGRADSPASAADGGRQYVYAMSNDGYAYDGSYEILGRVPRSEIGNLNAADWQFYTGPSGGAGPDPADSDPADWTGYGHIASATRLISAPHQLSQASVQYVPALGEYVLTSFWYPFSSQWPGQDQNSTTTWSFYAAPHPWGPWQQFFSAPTDLCYVTCQSAGTGTLGLYDPALVPKFSTEDGLGAVVFSSGDWSARVRPGDELYKLHAFPVTFTTSAEHVVDDTAPGITYSGDWVSDYDAPGFTDETDHYSGGRPCAPASASFSFTGTSIAWIGSDNDNHGLARVTVDGGAPVTVDTYARTWLKQEVLFRRSGLASGPHTITIAVTCAKTRASRGTYQDIDAFIVGG